MEELDKQRRLRELKEKYLDPVEKDLADELSKLRNSEQDSLEQRIPESQISSAQEAKMQEPSALYVAAAIGADICKSVARMPLDYLVGLLPRNVQNKLYGERSVRATKTNCLLQPLVTGSTVYLLMQNQELGNQIGGRIMGVVIEMYLSLWRYPGYLNNLYFNPAVKPVGHPVLTAPYHLLRISAQFATQTVPKYLSNVYSRKKEDIIRKRKL